MRVTEHTNFCRVIELPTEYPEGFCFGGGRPLMVKMVDWFNPVQRPGFGPTPGYDWKDGVLELSVEQAEQLRESLRAFIRPKRYIKPGRQYAVITTYGDAFLVSRESI